MELGNREFCAKLPFEIKLQCMSVLILPPEGGLKGSLPKYFKIGNTE